MSEPILVSGERRDFFPKLFNELGYKVGVEIGVYRGMFSEHLLKTVKGLKMYGVDPWTSYKDYNQNVGQHKLDAIYEDAVNRLKKYNCELIRKTSYDAVNHFEDESVDFVYIDGNHGFWHIATDVCLWEPKVRKGGVVSGHDYIDTARTHYKHSGCQVRSVVRAYTNAFDINPWYVIVGNEERTPSWYWKKKKIGILQEI